MILKIQPRWVAIQLEAIQVELPVAIQEERSVEIKSRASAMRISSVLKTGIARRI
jgi:hypothetical protein